MNEQKKTKGAKWFGIPNLVPYMRPYGKLIFWMVLMAFYGSAMDAVIPLFQQYAIDHYIADSTLAGLGWFIGAGSAAAAGIGVLLMLFPYASGRINTWRDPFSSSSDEGYQIVQSLYTIGSGGLSGLGLGMSRQKYLYLPEEHNDFIFSVVCEELGFIGAALILLLFALLILRGYWIALHCRDRFSFLVVAGITTLLAIQVFLNVAVVTNLVPCTGISLPFFSYGGTALLIQLGEMGIILSASRDVIEK